MGIAQTIVILPELLHSRLASVAFTSPCSPRVRVVLYRRVVTDAEFWTQRPRLSGSHAKPPEATQPVVSFLKP